MNRTLRNAIRAHRRTALRARTQDERNRCWEANIRTRKTPRRGVMDRGILAEFVRNGVEHRYHATKGWRSVRLTGR